MCSLLESKYNPEIFSKLWHKTKNKAKQNDDDILYNMH